MFRVLVCGGRDFALPKTDEWNFVQDTLERMFGSFENFSDDGKVVDVVIIHGGAKGADTAADYWAVHAGAGVNEYKADWKKHGKAAGPIRNKQMLDEGKPDLVIAFPGGKGTANMVKQARERNIEVREIKYPKQDDPMAAAFVGLRENSSIQLETFSTLTQSLVSKNDSKT